jgi:ribonucleoside-diphosphate reductase alpha chain
MRVFDSATGAIKQGGVRRGANLGCLEITHFDILEFINCKRDLHSFPNFNISVGVLDSFMEAVRKGEGFYLYNKNTNERRLVDAQVIFDEICQSIWECGDPGIIFLDEVNRHNPAPWLGRIHTTNPCGEQPLHDWGVCNLGSIDLSKFRRGNVIDYDRLDRVVQTAVRFLDDVITVNNYPIPKIKNKALGLRQVGLGVMGWADLLVQLGIQYDAVKALDLATEMAKSIQVSAEKASEKLSRERAPFRNGHHRRNASLTTIAPTGTLSILADCSSGIEPIFAHDFTKTVLDGKKLEMGSRGLQAEIKTAGQLSVDAHLKMQAAWQAEIDNGVSKTINMPHTTTKKEIADAINLAYDLKLKGFTCYRDGSRPEQPLIEKQPKKHSECSSDRCQI